MRPGSPRLIHLVPSPLTTYCCEQQNNRFVHVHQGSELARPSGIARSVKFLQDAADNEGVPYAALLSEDASPQQRNVSAPVILLMDGDRDFSADCVPALAEAGYEVVTAADSQELQYVCELYPRPIDVFVLDIPLERDISLEGLLPRQYGNKMVSLIRVTR